MNDLVRELEDKANCMMKHCDDPDLLDAAYFMLKAAHSVKCYEARKRKEEYYAQHPDKERDSGLHPPVQ